MPARPAATLFSMWSLLIVLLLTLRLPLLLHDGFVDDEVIYALAGQEIAANGVIYVSAIERKPPLLLWLYAGTSRLFGPYNHRALHLFATAWILATMAALYAMSRSWFDGRTGLAAAALYAIYQQWAFPANTAFNGEVLMNLPLAWAFALAVRPEAVSHPRWLIAGMLVGTAFLLKQPAGIAIVPLAVAAVLDADGRGRFSRAAAAVAGMAIVLALVSVWLYRTGVFREAWYWTVQDHDVPHIFWQYAIEKTTVFVLVGLPLLAGAWWSLGEREGALLAPHLSGWQRGRWRLVLALFVVVSAIGAAAGGRFYAHYYIPIILPLALLAGPALERALRNDLGVVGRRSAIAVLAVTVVMFTVIEWRWMKALPTDTDTARYLRAQAAANDRIFVWGRGTRLYLDAQRRPATRFIATFPLTGRIFGSPPIEADTHARIHPEAWDQLRADFSAHPPAFIVDMEMGGPGSYPLREFAWLSGYVSDHYTEVTRTPEGTIYRRRT